MRSLLNRDWRRIAIEAGTAVETLLASDPPLVNYVWRHMQGWYKTTKKHPPPPTHIILSHITVERVDIYLWDPSTGYIISIGMNPFMVDDYIPSMENIEWEVRQLWSYHSGGPSGK